MNCYYCDNEFQPKDIAVELELVTFDEVTPQSYSTEPYDKVFAHQECLRGSR